MFEPISSIIRRRAAKPLLKREADILKLWSEEVGKEIAGATKVISLEAGKLIIKTEDSSLARELEGNKKRIINSLNRAANRRLVKEIVFII